MNYFKSFASIFLFLIYPTPTIACGGDKPDEMKKEFYFSYNDVEVRGEDIDLLIKKENVKKSELPPNSSFIEDSNPGIVVAQYRCVGGKFYFKTFGKEKKVACK